MQIRLKDHAKWRNDDKSHGAIKHCFRSSSFRIIIRNSISCFPFLESWKKTDNILCFYNEFERNRAPFIKRHIDIKYIEKVKYYKSFREKDISHSWFVPSIKNNALVGSFFSVDSLGSGSFGLSVLELQFYSRGWTGWILSSWYWYV